MALFNRSLLQIHRNRAALKLHEHDFLIQFSAADIMERTDAMTMRPNDILELGARHGILTQSLLAKYPSSNIVACDISDKMLALNPAKHKIVLDEEKMNFECDTFSLIASVLNIHWINDLPKFLHNINKILTTDGVFIASLFGGTTLRNLRRTLVKAEISTHSTHTAHISPFASADDIYRLLQQAGFAFVVVDSQKIEVEYTSSIDLMHDLQDMGEANNLTQAPKLISKNVLSHIRANDVVPFIDHYEIITLTCSKDAKYTFTYGKDVQK
jgi:NADH dehydrogenase [ubiquinone] 1 alpha subcomplex assembly factor 5